MGTVVITDCDHGNVDIELEVFGSAGLKTTVARCRSAADVVAAGRGALALVTQYAPVTRAVLDQLPTVRAVARYGTGVDTIVVVSDRAVRAGRWDLDAVRQVRRISTMRLGLVGVGRIGAMVARKASALGFEVAAYDMVGVPDGIEQLDFAGLLAGSHVVSLHLPLTEQTRHLIGEAELDLMRPGAFLVNTARGAIVDEVALAAALRKGKLGGAGLDVVDSEPLAADSPLRDCPNVVITPHVGFYSQQALHELKRRVATGVVAALRTKAAA